MHRPYKMSTQSALSEQQTVPVNPSDTSDPLLILHIKHALVMKGGAAWSMVHES